MKQVPVADYNEWRTEARGALAADVPPDSIDFLDGALAPSGGLFVATAPGPQLPAITVPRAFTELSAQAACFRDPERWNLLYRILYRLIHGEKHLLAIEIDDDVRRARLMAKAVGRDIHKMHAFVRFRRIETVEGETYIAWHRPDHYIVQSAVPFFVRRFGSMRWSILTPDRSAYWDMKELRFGPGVPRSAAPDGDDLEELWSTYYASIFNPARVKIRAMKAEMPVRHWATLPEAQQIPALLVHADRRVEQMAEKQVPSARPWVPEQPTLPALITASKTCHGCDLYLHATQTVFGEGPARAAVMMVGEQPGDQEDLQGRPFVGPAGKILDKALLEAGVDRAQVYVTNAVKHFKFIERGKRRIHGKPSGIEVSACKPWLEAEVDVVRPELIVCLGATAAQSLMGRDFRITKDRGAFFPHRWGPVLMATIHPSAILRMPDEDRRREEYELFVRDLALIPERAASARLSA